jgi:hypothetical protein
MYSTAANRLRTTFLPGEDPDGSERRTVADQPIVIYRPKPGRKIVGLTFVVTAANIPLSKYASTIAALNSVDHVVVGIFANVLNPPRGNHRAKAEKIRLVFRELRDEFQVRQYDMVGHSIGGKIALLVAALYDSENWVRNIVALDPVDQTPVEFTNDVSSRRMTILERAGGADDASTSSTASKMGRGRRDNLSLESSKADITLTFTDTGYWIGKTHNAREIQRKNPSVKLVLHRNSYHFVYCDDEGQLSWKALMGRGMSSDRNQIVREETMTLIKEKAMRSTIAGHATGSITSAVGKAKKAVTNGIADLKGLGEEAQKKGTALAGAATLAKVMG